MVLLSMLSIWFVKGQGDFSSLYTPFTFVEPIVVLNLLASQHLTWIGTWCCPIISRRGGCEVKNNSGVHTCSYHRPRQKARRTVRGGACAASPRELAAFVAQSLGRCGPRTAGRGGSACGKSKQRNLTPSLRK